MGPNGSQSCCWTYLCMDCLYYHSCNSQLQRSKSDLLGLDYRIDSRFIPSYYRNDGRINSLEFIYRFTPFAFHLFTFWIIDLYDSTRIKKANIKQINKRSLFVRVIFFYGYSLIFPLFIFPTTKTLRKYNLLYSLSAPHDWYCLFL